MASSLMGAALELISALSPEERARSSASTKSYAFSRASPAPPPPPASRRRFNTVVEVADMDTLDAASRLVEEEGGSVPAVLNHANAFNCGGGFCVHMGAQEEYLFRQSSLSASVWPHRRLDDGRWPEGSLLLDGDGDGSRTSFYPFTEAGGIYSGSVTAFGKDGPPPGAKMFPIAVMTVAAQDLRPDRPYPTSPVFEYDRLLQSLRSALHMALEHGHTRLVLGAIGCGAFRNPPEEVARAYRALLVQASEGEEGEFAGCFDKVVFAVSRNEHNLQVFRAALAPA